MTATLKRKMVGEHREGVAPKMTTLRALRLSIARASEDLFGLALAVSGGREHRVLPDELTPFFSDEDLLIVMDCQGGFAGAASVSLPLVVALIQQLTTGRVADRPIEKRAYTDTDAALVAPLLETVLSRAHNLIKEGDDRTCFQSIRFGARAEDARSLILSLRAERYQAFSLPIDVALGRHQATMTFVLPIDDNEEAASALEEPDGAERAAKSPFLDVETDLCAVLARFRLPVNALNALSVGDTLPLSRERLDDTALVTLTDRVVARGKLGQMNGHRAVRLMAPPPVPKVGHPAGFDPQVTKQTEEGTAEDNAAHTSPDEEGVILDLDASDLGDLSTDEVVEQISGLARLTPEDLDAVGSTLPMDQEDIPLPTVFPPKQSDGDTVP